ncbi:hypothetical protein V1517DRAFT_377031 [Lipomyces orientalis]|uniref:Uncharacterized protein n=1 Tax=Lipomyces orientalis TaxID=1233043 RepID=A0ACC3TCV6_9ASCO
MDQKTLLDALTTVWTIVPDDARFHVPVANHQYGVRLLILSLLNHGYSPNSIADDLWYDLVIRNNRVNLLSEFFVLNDVSSLMDIKSSSGTLPPADGTTWHCQPSDSLNLMAYGRQYCTGPRILARDGVVSPVGQAIDNSAPLAVRPPLDVRQSNRARVVRLSYNTVHGVQNLRLGLKTLTEGTGCANLAVERAAYGFIGDRSNGDEIIFGMAPQANHIALPDGELFNIHLAIGRVRHASGAGEVISKIMRDEEDYNEGNVKDASSAARISALELKLELKRLEDEDSESDILQERRRIS